ncbi:hypothetical protein A2Y85_01085 [candidate division WOR-3 bacterium RBG_13_43_14]|uniref:DUF5723 domain-containing protein n=1 Tax=candidate division WOR-3 bacterium RBG_13_43_14 TaxID=1802590 RepID=A0A1F4UAE2_UNCW3|nr:MAG: hypothetical protein A2Y85_01085 [candidate division WOR-3 bacterium RBG_13_43_14]
MLYLIYFLINSSGVNSLLLPVSPLGLTAGFSNADRTEAIFYNPSKFRAEDKYMLWCSYNQFYLDMHSVSMALSKKFGKIGIGIGFVNFDYGEIEWHPDYPTEDPLTNYTANDFSIILGASTDITEQGRIGLNLKYISENIMIYSDYALAFDLAFSYRNEKSSISLGVTNFGSQLTIRNDDINLPAKLSMGLTYQFNKFGLGGDAHYLVNTSDFEGDMSVNVPLHPILAINLAAQYRERIFPAFGFDMAIGNIAFKYAGSIYPRSLGMINTLGIGFEF